MQNLTEHKPGIGTIISEAFSYWSRTLLFQLVFSLLFFSILFLAYFYFATKWGFLENFIEILNKKPDPKVMVEQFQALQQTPAGMKLSWILTLVLVLLYPLNVGFFKIYRKMDLGEKPGLEDLISGYTGINFMIFVGFYLFWLMVYQLSSVTVILAVVWVFITLFTAPLMFFMDKRIVETIPYNIQALKKYFPEILICFLVAVIFKYAGMFTIIGGLFTFPFANAMIYTLYKHIFKELD